MFAVIFLHFILILTAYALTIERGRKEKMYRVVLVILVGGKGRYVGEQFW